MLPLALALVLGAALAFQALLGDPLDLPPSGAVRGGGHPQAVATRPDRVIADSAIAGRAMFTPIFQPPPGGTAAGQAGSPLGALAVVGVMRIGRATYAVVQGPGEQVSRAGPGQRIGDWRVLRVTPDEVQLARGGERLRVRLGPSGPQVTVTGKGES